MGYRSTAGSFLLQSRGLVNGWQALAPDGMERSGRFEWRKLPAVAARFPVKPGKTWSRGGRHAGEDAKPGAGKDAKPGRTGLQEVAPVVGVLDGSVLDAAEILVEFLTDGTDL